jgi:hypothetical protein
MRDRYRTQEADAQTAAILPEPQLLILRCIDAAHDVRLTTAV